MPLIHVLSIVALGLSFATPAVAGPWCANDPRGSSNCGFQTFEQCLANISGAGGSCTENPEEPPGSQAERSNEPQEPAEPEPAPANLWCADDSRGNTNCGFDSFEHCQRALAGVAGTCIRNRY